MELRSCSDLHLIWTCRSGFVTRIQNVDTQGKPALKFKKVKDFYETKDENVFSSTSLQTNGHGSFPIDCVRVERPLPLAERKTITSDEAESLIFKGNISDEEINSGSDDSFGDMTLKQLKERCKSKKRKLIDLVNQNGETFSSTKQECPTLLPEEDKLDLEEPLIRLKTKKHINKHISKMSQCAASVVKLEEVSNDQDSKSCMELPASIDIKVDVRGSDCSDSQNMNFFAHELSVGCSGPAGSYAVVSDEMLGTASDCILETGQSVSCREETENCNAKGVSYEYMDRNKPDYCLNARVTVGEIADVDNPDMTSHNSSTSLVSEFKEGYTFHRLPGDSFEETHVFTKDCSPATHDTTCSVSNEMPQQIGGDAGVQRPEMGIDDDLKCMELCYECDSHVQEFKGEEYLLHPLSSDNSQETSSSAKDYSSDAHEMPQICSVMNEMPWQINNCAGVQVSDMGIDSSLKCTEFSCEGDVCVEENNNAGLLPNLKIDDISSSIGHCSSPWNSCQSSSPYSCGVSVDLDSHRTVGKISHMPINADTQNNCSAGNQAFDSDDGLTTSGVIGNDCSLKQQHPPGRLLSARKTFSPTSQERLCQAMKSIELYDDEKNYESKGKLCFGETNENKASLPRCDLKGAEVTGIHEGLQQFKISEINVPLKSIVRKPKINKIGSHPKGILKFPRHSRVLPSLSTGCSSVQSCSQNAIAFSQRQMHDFEFLATKLTKELDSMRGILEEKLHPEACATTSLNDNADEVRVAIENATKAEETCSRWLSMMRRDCSRFCKIMKLTESGRAASQNEVPKERKKISFADEAGGILCHVKFLEDHMASQSESRSENKLN